MKYLSFIFLFVVLFQGTHQEKVHAGAVIGSTFPQQLVDNILFVKQTADGTVSTVAQVANTFQNTVGDVIGQSLITAAQQEAARQTLNWANGGTDGSPSLIINNPQKYAEQQARGAVKSLIGDISNNPNISSVYSNSIAGSLIAQYKNKDLATQLADIAHSNVPTMTQESMCS